MIDGYVQANGLDAPAEELRNRADGTSANNSGTDLKEAGITTVIWATGYTYDYGLVKMPVFDGGGRSRRGE